jgi:multisubunit Na+/H+ antiporter MnhF subunit
MSDSAPSQVHTIDRVRAILNVAWLAILLGIGVQLLVFAVRLVLGSDLVGAVLLSNLTQGITWGVIVCVGVAIGVTVERSRALLGGLLGLISGPLGWGLAKSAQRTVQALLGTAVDQFTEFFFLLVAIKGVEYLLLGTAVGRLGDRPHAAWHDYARPGLIVGIVFSALVVALTWWHAGAIGQPIAMPALAGLAVSELTFPIGCALVIYVPMRLQRYTGLV